MNYLGRKFVFKAIFAFGVLLFSGIFFNIDLEKAYATEYVWNPNASYSACQTTDPTQCIWSNGGNWDPMGVPGAGDTAWVSNSGMNPVIVDQDISVENLYLSDSSSINFSGHGVALSGSWSTGQNISIDAPPDVTLTGTGAITTNSYQQQTLGDVDIAGSYVLSGDMYADSLTLENESSLNYGDCNIHLAGSWTNLGGTQAFSGYPYLEGTGTINTQSNQDFEWLYISGNYALGSDLDLMGGLNITGNNLNVAGHNITVLGDFSMEEGRTLENAENTLVTLGGSGYVSGSGIANITVLGTYIFESDLSITGSLNIDQNASFTANNGASLTIAGNLTNNKDSNNIAGVITLTGADTSIGGDKSITSMCAGDFDSLIIAGGTYQLQGCLDISEDLTINSGAVLDANNQAISVGGDWGNNSGGSIINVSDVTLGVSGAVYASSEEFGSLTINGAYSLESNIHVNGNFTINDGGSLTANNHSITVGGSYIPGNQALNTPVTLDGSGELYTVGTDDFASLNISGIYILQNNSLDVNGTLNVSGELDMSGYDITLNGSLLNGGTISNMGDVTMTGSSISMTGSNTIANLTVTPSALATLTFAKDSVQTISGNLTFQGSSAADYLTIQGNAGTWSFSAAGTKNITNTKFINTINTGSVIDLSAITSVQDGNGNDGFIFYVPDSTAPEITLTGGASMSITKGDTWSDPGCTATDETDGSVSCTLTSGTVDSDTVGTYTLTYSATDAANNTATADRTVSVVAPAPAPVVSLPSFGGGTVQLNPVTLKPLRLEELRLKDLPIISVTPNTDLGTTNIPNPLEGVASPGKLNLKSVTAFSFVPSLSSFLFAPLPKDIIAYLDNFPELKAKLAASDTTRTQELAKVLRAPLAVPTLKDLGVTDADFSAKALPPDVFFADTGGAPLVTTISLQNERPVQLLKASSSQVINLAIKPSAKNAKLIFNGFPADAQLADSLIRATVIVPNDPGTYQATLGSSTLSITVENSGAALKTKLPGTKPSLWQKLKDLF